MIMTLPHRLSFLSPLLTEVSLSATASYIPLQKGDFTKQLTNHMTTKVCLYVCDNYITMMKKIIIMPELSSSPAIAGGLTWPGGCGPLALVVVGVA